MHHLESLFGYKVLVEDSGVLCLAYLGARMTLLQRQPPLGYGISFYRVVFFLGRLLWFLVCGFMVVLWFEEIGQVRIKPDQYASLWGSEGPAGGLWYYASEPVYLFHLVCLVIWFLCGMFLCLSSRPRVRKFLPAHFALSLMWTGTCMYVRIYE